MVSVERNHFEDLVATLFFCTLLNICWFLFIAAIFEYGKVNREAFIFGLVCGMVSSVFLSGYIFILVYRKELTNWVHQQHVLNNAEQELEKLKKKFLEEMSKQIKSQ